MTAAAGLAAVAAGLSASPAMAATAHVASTGVAVQAASQPGTFGLDAAAAAAPFGQLAAPAQQPAAPIAQSVPTGPLYPAAPHQVPAQPSQHPVVRIRVANSGSTHPGSAQHQAAPASHAAVQHAAQPAAHRPQRPAPPPRPYLIYDSVTPTAIPPHRVVATYATGGYAVPASQVAGRNRVFWIDTQGTDPAAAALDVEPGDATPSVAAAWAWHKLSATPGAVARIYTMISEWPAVKAAIATLPPRMQSHVRYWIADPTGVPHVLPGASATQWYWGKSYDISTATPGF